MLRHLVSVLAGALGFIVIWTGWHLYQDHLALHQVITFLSQRPAMGPGK